MRPSAEPQTPHPARSREDRPGAPTTPPPAAGARRPYCPPRLEHHGALAEVTRFGGSQIVDSGGGLGQQF